MESIKNINNIINEIIADNSSFVENHNKEFFEGHSKKQSPFITMVSCSDSRVQPEVILSDAINRIFLVENIGNQILSSEGSVDYGIYHLKTPVLLILGHSDCGAITAYMKGYDNELPSIKNELDNFKPAIKQNINSENFDEELLGNIQKNIDYQVDVALKKYSLLIEENKLCVIGAFYDFNNDFSKEFGKVFISNINGNKDVESIKKSDFFANTPSKIIENTVKRL